ncbi:MAG: MoaD/ThiS family protein [Pyrinomonadaceae bacterium]
MAISILFFGATAEIAGKRQMSAEITPGSNAGDVFGKLIEGIPKLKNHRLHYSINQQYATGDEIIRDGDELAIFTAVSGG